MRPFLCAPIGVILFRIGIDLYSLMCFGCYFPFWLWVVSGFSDQSAYFCNCGGIVDPSLCLFCGGLGNLPDYVVRMYLTRAEEFCEVLLVGLS